MNYIRYALAALALIAATQSTLLIGTTAASAFNANPHANTDSGAKSGWTTGTHNPHQP